MKKGLFCEQGEVTIFLALRITRKAGRLSEEQSLADLGPEEVVGDVGGCTASLALGLALEGKLGKRASTNTHGSRP